jgi:hypothetical protein
MKKKQPWMKVGAIVLALGKPGTITKMQENTLDGVEYVYNISVKLSGAKFANPYHPNDVKELTGEDVRNG